MANEIRLRSNNISGTITDNPLSNVATTINSPGFVDLPTVGTTQHLILILDPLELAGPAEIVTVTAHTAASSVVTVTRGAEGSSARTHSLATTWFHGPVASDFNTPGQGVLAYNEITSAQTGITAETDVTNSTVTVVVGANRRIRLTGVLVYNRSVADGITRMRIKEGATLLTIGDGFVRVAAEGQLLLYASRVITPSTGSHTYKLTIARDSGTGTVATGVFADNPGFILVEDIGSV